MNTTVCVTHLIIGWAESGCNEVLWILKLLHSHSITFLSESAPCWYNWSLAARPRPALLVWKRWTCVLERFLCVFVKFALQGRDGTSNLLIFHTDSSLLLNVSVDCLSQTPEEEEVCSNSGCNNVTTIIYSTRDSSSTLSRLFLFFILTSWTIEDFLPTSVAKTQRFPLHLKVDLRGCELN